MMTPDRVEVEPVRAPMMHPERPSKKKKGRGWIWLLLLLCAAGAGAYFYYPYATQIATKGQGKDKKGKATDASRAVPVVASKARRGDMPVYLNGLGTVTAFNTVTIRSRVDGELVKVAFQEGQLVKEGDLLAEIDPRPYQVQLEQMEGQMARDEATLKNARLDLERYRVLLSQDAIPRQQMDTQAATVNQSEGAIKADQAQVDNAKLQLVYAHIVAPLSGRIGLRLVDKGNMVHATDVNGLAVITQLQPISVYFNIPEDSLPQVIKQINAGEHPLVEAWDRDVKTKLAVGSLLTIDNQIDQTTGTVRFKGVFENKDNSLFPNQFVNARLLVSTRHGAVIIPSAAIQRSPDSTFVYVVKPDNTVEVRNVATSLTEGDQATVDKGLDAGEAVVIDGVDKLQQGTKVTARMAGASPKG